MATITICLWFDGRAEEAAQFYVETFLACGQTASLSGGSLPDDTEIGHTTKKMTVQFTLAGQPFIALNGGPMFTFSPAISMFVSCGDQAEVDAFWDRLSEGGTVQRCGWLKDKFGVSWQVVPTVLGKLLGDPDRDRAHRVMQAMLAMIKLDIAGLEAAAKG